MSGIDRDCINVTDLALFRPQRQGSANDESGPPVEIATGLCGIYEPSQRLFKDAQGRELQISAIIRIEGTDSDGDVIDVRAGDHAQWTDFRGKLLKRQLILRVDPWWHGFDLDHVELRIGST